jgi:hypothetical protein
LGGVPRGVQDRVRERADGFFAPNQCRRVCNDWPLVAALLLVLSLIVAQALLRSKGDQMALPNCASIAVLAVADVRAAHSAVLLLNLMADAQEQCDRRGYDAAFASEVTPVDGHRRVALQLSDFTPTCRAKLPIGVFATSLIVIPAFEYGGLVVGSCAASGTLCRSGLFTTGRPSLHSAALHRLWCGFG